MAHVKREGGDCAVENVNLMAAFIMYASYAGLFLNFLIRCVNWICELHVCVMRVTRGIWEESASCKQIHYKLIQAFLLFSPFRAEE